MPSIAIQGAVGEVGRKPVTEIPFLSMDSVGSINGFPFGCGKEGFFTLNAVELPAEHEAFFILNTSHLGYPKNLKKLNYLYVAMDGDVSGVTVIASHDGSDFQEFGRCVPHGRGFRAAMYSRCQGVYWTIGIKSSNFFSVDSMSLLFTVRPAGVGGC